MTADGGEPLADLADLLADDHARTILAAVSEEPRSAEELSDRCGASRTTVYRRLSTLREHDLVRAERRLDPDGHHHEVFVARFEWLHVELADGEYEVDIGRRPADAADRLTELFEGLR